MNSRKLTFSVLAFALTLLPAAGVSVAREKKPESLKVMSYNIRNGEAQDGTNSWQYRAPATVMMLEDRKPDLFGVQEAYDYQVRAILDYTDYKAVGVGREDGKHGGEHMSVFYNPKRIRLKKWGTFWLSETPEKPSLGWDAACIRTATWALVKDRHTGKSFYFVNTHLDHVGVEARKNGLRLIVDRIGKLNRKRLPVVLTGDFNITPKNKALAVLDGVLKDARTTAVKSDPSGSFHDWGKLVPGIPIDYIWYSGFSSCPVFEVVRKPYYDRQFISDHYPIQALLVF